jgi:chromate reductase
MSAPPEAAAKVLVFAGSTRTASLNKKLAAVAARAAEQAGARVTRIDLRDFPMPLYDGDLEAEAGVPEHGRRLKQLFFEHDALLISAPEYNGSISGVLKNAIDWCSRREGDEAALAAFRGKVAGLVSASPGRLGGARSLMTLRHVLSVCRCLVVPAQFSLAAANKAFGDDGELADETARAGVEEVARQTVETARRLTAQAR